MVIHQRCSNMRHISGAGTRNVEIKILKETFRSGRVARWKSASVLEVHFSA